MMPVPDDTFEKLALQAIMNNARLDESIRNEPGAGPRFARIEGQIRHLEDIAILTSSSRPAPKNDPIVMAAMKAIATKSHKKILTKLLVGAAVIVLALILWPESDPASPEPSLADLRPGSEMLEKQLGITKSHKDLWLAMNGEFSSLARLVPEDPGSPTKGQAAAGVIPLTILAPDGATHSLKPSILWESHNEKRYNVSVRDEHETILFLAMNANSPLSFGSLAPQTELTKLESNTIYLIEVSATDSTQKAVSFVATTENAHTQETAISSTPAQIVIQCLDHLSHQNPPAFGDILEKLHRLPNDIQGDEVVVRLKLYCFSKRGKYSEFQRLFKQHARE